MEPFTGIVMQAEARELGKRGRRLCGGSTNRILICERVGLM
jgi:hypothetical protein